MSFFQKMFFQKIHIFKKVALKKKAAHDTSGPGPGPGPGRAHKRDIRDDFGMILG